MKTRISLGIIVWLSGLSMLSFLATDMYLPAFASMQQQFSTGTSQIGWTLSIFLLGMAIGQLAYGPLSDRFGRIRMLCVGLFIFIIASLGCAYAPNIYLLMTSRLFQAIGACAASVIWQAIIIDRYESPLSERLFATIMPLVALSPALAPLAGAVLNHHLGWQSIFLVLMIIGLVLVAFSLRQTDKRPEIPAQDKLSGWKQMKLDYRQILSSAQFNGNTLIFAACAATFFAWLTGSPFIMTELGYSASAIGLSYLPQTIAFVAGGYACRALLTKIPGHKLVPWFLGLFVLGVLLMTGIACFYRPTTIWPLLLPFCLIAVANSALYPIVINQALGEFKNCAATASGLLNFLQTMLSFLMSALVSWLASDGMQAVTLVMLSQAFLVLLGYAVSRYRARPQLQTASSL
ncbi:purine nucleoside transporter PunC [Dongshaea marina]|uniref:purine nucleoside transporter PunC n=1 Tax=Dongshaea marina TaxID=2047966 RepID=UPI000D3EACAD|nr:purine nucleoside transporter PunC [Dongshaea marina]